MADLARLVEREHRVRSQSATSSYMLLAKCGLSHQCPAKPYKSHSDLKVMEFEEVARKKIIAVAQDVPDTVILAQEEASLYLQASRIRVFAPVG